MRKLLYPSDFNTNKSPKKASPRVSQVRSSIERNPWIAAAATQSKGESSSPQTLPAVNNISPSPYGSYKAPESQEEVRISESLDVDDSQELKYFAPIKPSNHITLKLPETEYAQTVGFQFYKSTRPDLLQRLEHIVHTKLKHNHTSPTKPAENSHPLPSHRPAHSNKKLKKKNGQHDQHQAVEETAEASLQELKNRHLVYHEVFSTYIEAATLYQPILSQSQSASDAYIISLEQALHRLIDEQEQTVIANHENEEHLQAITNEHQQQIKSLQEQLKQTELKVAMVEKEKAKSETALKQVATNQAQAKKEADDLRATANTLTSSLARMEEEHRQIQAMEASRLSELNYLRSGEQKLNEEIERLQQVIAGLEQQASTMVNQESIAALELAVDSMKTEMKRTEITHRSLLLRYAALKAVADDCCRRWTQSTNITSDNAGVSGTIIMEKTRKLLDSALANNHRHNQHQQQHHSDPAERLLTALQSGSFNPCTLLEVMLDRLSNGSGGAGGGGYGAGSYADQSHHGQKGQYFEFADTHTNTVGKGSYSLFDPNAVTQSDDLNTANNPGHNITSAALQLSEEFRSPWHHFDGLLGPSSLSMVMSNVTVDNVPDYLRFAGKLQNLFLSRKDTAQLLREIWAARAAHDRLKARQQAEMEQQRAVIENGPLNTFAVNNIVNEERASMSSGGGGGLGSRRQSASNSAHGNRRPSSNQNSNINNSVSASRPASSLMPTASQPAASTVSLAVGVAVAQAAKEQAVLSAVSALPRNAPMAVFLHAYLNDRFHHDRTFTAEAAYNLHDALKRHAQLSDCKLFSAVLDEKLPSESYDELKDMIERLKEESRKELKILYAAANSASNGSTINDGSVVKLTSDVLLRIVKRINPTKPEHSMNRLAKALSVDSQGGGGRFVDAEALLSDNMHLDSVAVADKGNSNSNNSSIRSAFLEQLQLQHVSEALSFSKHVLDCINQFTTSDSSHHEGQTPSSASTMTVGRLREALSYADPNKPRSEVNRLLARAAGVGVEEVLLLEAKRTGLALEGLIRKLKGGLLVKSPPAAGGAGSSKGSSRQPPLAT